MNLLALTLVLLFPLTALADGVNRKKRKPKPKPKPKVVKLVVKPTPVSKVPPLLESESVRAVTFPTLRPTQPLLDVPSVPVQPFVGTETRVFTIEEHKDRGALWFLIGGGIAAGAIVILLNDKPLPPTPQSTLVPEPTSLGLLIVGLWLARKRWIKEK